MTEDETVAAMIAEIQGCEAPIELVLRPLSAFQLASLLQLALRHPGAADGSVARMGRIFIEQVRRYFDDHDCHIVLEIMQAGDDPSKDR